MPSDFLISLDAKRDVCLAISALVDSGSGPGQMRIYDDGEGAGIPASCEAPPTGQPLCTATLAKPAFVTPAELSDSMDGQPVALAPIGVSGLADHFRVMTSESVVVMQGTAGEVGGSHDLDLDNDELHVGGSVQLDSMVFLAVQE